MVNAHQHLTGDPLVRSCIPDRITTDEADLRVGGADPRRPHCRRRRAGRPFGGGREPSLRHDDAGRGRHRRPSATASRRPWWTPASAAPSARGVGTSRRPLRRPPPARSSTARRRCARPIRRGPGGGMGDPRRPRPRLRRAARRCRRAGPGARHPALRCTCRRRRPDTGSLPRPRRPAAAGAPRAISACSVRICWSPTACGSTRRRSSSSSRTRTAVAYCPWAYLRLAQGVTRGRAPRRDRSARGGRVALGCDASNAGDIADILRTAALASALARDTPWIPSEFGADTVFELATIAGAEAIGMDDRVGSLEPGKAADLVVHDGRNITGRRPAIPPSISSGAPTGVRCATSSSMARSWCATAAAPPSTRTRCGRRP